MKKLLTLTAILALATAAWAKAPAQERPDDGPGHDGPGMHEDRGGGPGEMGSGPEVGLSLTDEQTKKLKALHEGQRETMMKLRRKMRDITAKLQDQIDDKASDSDLKATLKELKAGRKAMDSAREKMEAASEGIMTPLQRAKMALKFRGRGSVGMGMGMMGPGMMGGNGGPEHEGPDDKGGMDGKDAKGGKDDGGQQDHDAGKGRGHYND